MKVNKKPNGRALPFSQGIALGVLVSIVLTCLLSAILTWLIISERVGETLIGYVIMSIIFISTLSGSMLAASQIKRRRMLVCQTTGGIYYITLLILTALCFGGKYQGIGVTATMVFAGNLVAALTSSAPQKRTLKNKVRCKNC